MQVKKFEANTMKEALEMVKQHLGPEAIILSAKENKAGYGLGSSGSVEVAAAVSDLVLEKKKLAEAKMTGRRKESFSQLSARDQKKYIDRVFSDYREQSQPKHQVTRKSYIDIMDDEGTGESIPSGTSVARVESNQSRSAQRVSDAVQHARAAGDIFTDDEPLVPQASPRLRQHKGIADRDKKIARLENEIQLMRKLIQNFQSVPQTFVSMHPGADQGLPYELGFMHEELTGVGIDTSRTVEILKKAHAEISPIMLKKKHFVKAWVAKHLLDQIEVSGPESNETRFHAFVGSSGQGKTSALVKLASHLVIRERKKVVIVTCGTQKVGAAEQLRIFAQILNVPFCSVHRPEDWQLVQKQLGDVSHILVDYPANLLRSQDEYEALRTMLPPTQGGRSIHLVQSVLAKDIDAMEIAKRYQQLPVSDLVFTCLDESVQHGVIYNIHKETDLPLHSFGIGPQIPEDYEMATKERVIDLLFKLTKVKQERDYL